MKAHPVRLAASAVVLGAALLAAASVASAQDAARSFDGWTVVFEGLEERFPASDDWTGVALRDGYQLTRSDQSITWYGSFRVERTSKAPPHSARGVKEDEGDGWSVWHAGEDRYFPRTEGWIGRGNADGWYLERRGQAVWYYGNFRVIERPKDHSDLRGR